MAAEVGFDWPDPSGPLAKIEEELEEVRGAARAGDKNALSGEIGDLLFAISSFCRHHAIDAETALRGALDRFTTRFQAMESELRSEEDRSLPRLDALWSRAKSETQVEEVGPATEEKKGS